MTTINLSSSDLNGIFREPKKWGLRGDQALWLHIKEKVLNSHQIFTSEQLLIFVQGIFDKLDLQRMGDHEDSFYVERFDRGGMSGGLISRSWWNEKGFLLLKERSEQRYKQSPRSPDVNDKPKAKEWLENNEAAATPFLWLIDDLVKRYTGDLHGYVDFAPAQYRFNNKTSGGCTFVTARTSGEVIIEVAVPNSSPEVFNKFQIKSPSERMEFKEFINSEIPYFSSLTKENHVGFDDEVRKSQKFNC